MRRKIGAAVAAAMIAGMTGGSAIAGERQVVGGVTILRGMTTGEQSAVGPAFGSSLPTNNVPGDVVDDSGKINELHLGNPGAGGEVATPPFNGAGR